MPKQMMDYDDDEAYLNEQEERDYRFRKPSHSRRRLEEHLEAKRLKKFLEDDYYYDSENV